MASRETYQFSVILFIVFIGLMGTALPYPIFAPMFLHPTSESIIPQSWSLAHRGILLAVTLSAFSFGQFIGSPIIGRLADIFGRRKILLYSLCLTLLTYILTAFAIDWSSVSLLIFFRFFTGAFEGNIPLARSIAADYTTIHKHISFGSISAVSAIGYIFGPILGGIFSDEKLVGWFSYAIPFYFSAFLLLIAVVAVIFTVRESYTPTRTHDNMLKLLNPLGRIGEFKATPNLLKLIFICSIFTLSVDMYYQYSPVYLAGYWDLQPSAIALFNAAMAVAMAISCGWLAYLFSRYFSIRYTVLVAMGFYAVILCLLFLSHSLSLTLGLFFAIGFAISFVVTNIPIEISNVSGPDIQGEVMGVLWGIRTFGDGCISLIGGILIIFSFRAPFLFSMVITLISMFGYWAWFMKKPQ